MANYTTLKAAIQQVVKTNGNNEITGALLQQSLLSMITSLGAGYQFMDVATPQTTPGTPDQNVFYIGGPGTYSNMGGTVVNDGEIGIFRYNGSWSNKKLAVGKDYSNEIAALRRDKLDKIVGNNLIDPGALTFGKAITWGGNIVTVGAQNYCVSDYIPVNGRNIISNAMSVENTWATYAVFDENKNLLRSGQSNQQYTYQSGDYYVVFSWGGFSSIRSASYGTTLYVEPYTDCLPITELQRQMVLVYPNALQVPNKLDKIIGNNIVNPDEIVIGAALSWNSTDGSLSTGLQSNFRVTGYIPINGNNIISNAYSSANTWATMFIYDSQFRFLRHNGTNQQYTYQQGDAYVRISFNSPNPQYQRANYGTTLLPYEPYTDYAPIQELQKSVEEMEQYIPGIKNKVDKILGVNIINPDELVEKRALPMSSTTGEPSVVSGSQYRISGFIPVNGQDIIANAWVDTTNNWATMFIYDENKNFLRNNGNNRQYTYQPGDGFVVISFNGSPQMANYGTVLADYEPYTDYAPIQELQKQIDEIANSTTGAYKQSNIIDVGVGFAFTDIQPAINSITDAAANNRYLIRIHDDFNITSVTQLWLLSNPATHASGISAACAFIQTKDFVDLEGAGRRVKISVKLPAVDSSSEQQVNCHCVFEKGDIRISNIEFESEYTRYTMHEENGSGAFNGSNSNKKKYFKNIILRYLRGTRYNRALGIGTAPGEECIYENCVIESYTESGNITDGVGNLHSHPNYAVPFKYTFRNCIISSSNFYQSSIYTDIRSGVKPTFVFEDCDFGCIVDFRSPTALGTQTLNEKSADWRNGGFYLIGHSNRGVLGRINPPCLYLETNNNNVDVAVVDDRATNVNSAYQLLFGDPIVVYPGATDAHGIYLGSQYIINTTGNVWSLRERLGNCSSVNKSFKVNVDGIEQTIVLNLDYSSMQDDADVIADINSKLTGCTLKTELYYKQLHWGDNVRLVKNTGNQTIYRGSIIADNGSIYGVKLANSGDVAIGIATERINPGQTGTMIVKGTQYMQGSGVPWDTVVGTKFKCGDNGVLVQDNTDAAQFVCINSAGIFKWIGV